MEKIKRLDLHGKNMEEALRVFEALVFSGWRRDEHVILEIVTGKGEIQQRIEEILNEHDFRWHYHPLTNKGCIRVLE